jgi:MFS family permease
MSERTVRPGPAEAKPPESVTSDAGRLEGASTGRLVAILVVLVLISEIVAFQYGMIANIIPKIGQTFPGAGAGVTWTVTIVGVGGGATMALIGKAADLYGKKRMLILAAVVFLIGALICATTDSWALFLVGRGLAAVSSGVTAISYGLVRDLMPRRWIPAAIGVLGTGFGFAGIVGPLVAGYLTDHFSWHSVFWFLLVYTAVMVPAVLVVVPESPIRIKQRFDVLGALLFGLGIGAVLIYVSEGGSWGWVKAGSLAYLVAGVAILLAFVAWERRTAHPMMELSLLKAPRVSMVMAVWFFGAWALTATSFATAYMMQSPSGGELKRQIVEGAAAQSKIPVEQMQQALQFNGDVSYGAGFSVLEVAVHITIWTSIAAMIVGPLSGWAARRYGCRLPLIIGMVLMVGGCAALMEWHKAWQQQAGMGVLLGVASGLYYSMCPNLLIDAVPAERQGVSSGMMVAVGAVGTATAPAVFTAVLSAHPFQTVAAGPAGRVVTDIPQVYTDAGYTQVYLIAGLVPALLGLLLALALRSGRAPARGGAITV